jgi:hypothetical protein
MQDSVMEQADSKTIKKVAQMTGRKTVLYYNHARRCWAEIIEGPESGLKFPLAVSLDVSPTLAADMLTHNLNNRRIDTRRVKRYATSIIKGEWRINNDDICFDVDGNLINGQHRLKAIIDSGKTVPMSFKFGCSPDALITIDEGRARSNYDVLKITGHPSSKAALAATNFILEQTQRKHTMPRADILAFNERCREGGEFATKLKSTPWAIAPIHAVIVRAFYHYRDPEERARLERFVEILSTGLYDNADEDAAAIFLRNSISRAGTISNSKDRMTFYRRAEAAIENFMTKTKVQFLKGFDRELFPLPEEK